MINNASWKRIISQLALNQIDPASLTNPIMNCVSTEVFFWSRFIWDCAVTAFPCYEGCCKGTFFTYFLMRLLT